MVVSRLSSAAALFAAVLHAGGRRFAVIVVLAVAAAGLESAALVALPLVIKAGGGGSVAVLPAMRAIGLPVMLAGYVVLVAVAAVLLYVQTMAVARLVLDYGEALRLRLYRAVMAAGWGAPVLARSADLTHALTTEAGQCAYAVRIAISAVARLLTLPALLTAAVLLSPGFTLAAVMLAALASLPMVPLNRSAYRMAGAMADAARAVNAEIADQMAGLRVLKMLRTESAGAAAFRRRVAGARAVQIAQTRAIAVVTAGQRVVIAAAAAAGGYYGLVVLRLETGALVALVLVFTRLSSGIAGIQEIWRQLARLLPVHDQLMARLEDARRAAEPAPAVVAPRLTRSIRFEDVGFTYPGAAAAALAGIDLVLPALSTTALVGPSGAGKSTLADLAMGLTAPTMGRIFIDDQLLEGPARVAWRSRVAYVPQDPFLFHDTLRANLLLARPDAADADLVKALAHAAAQFALALPNGLDTVVGDRGAGLSGGERQRIVLARALLTEPDLLVLDEATNALDHETEERVIETLRGLAGRMTILLVAHRRSAMTVADRTIRLEAGRVAAIRLESIDIDVTRMPGS